MAPRRPVKAQPPARGGGKKKKQKGATQKTPMERVMLIDGSGKKRMIWREWGS